jgi:hypothetical protein
VFELTRFVVGRQSAPLELPGTSCLLYVRQLIVVIGGHCQTESYTYRLQESDARDSWLIRWEYLRAPPHADYPYPPSHVHIRATFPGGTSADRLHIPTEPVPLEHVVWHLIAEWGVQPRTADWLHILRESRQQGSTSD